MEHDDQLNEDDAFAAGFAETLTEPAEKKAAPAAEPTTEEAKGTTPEAKPAEAAAPTDEASAIEDPFAGLPPQVRELLAEIPTLRAKTEAAEARARESVGRVGALQSEVAKLRQPAAPEAPAKPKFPKLEALRSEHELSEIADAFDEVIEQFTPKPQADPAPEPVQALPAASDPQMEALDELRSNWAQDLISSDFQLWLATQPKDYAQQIASTGKAAEILGALNKFDAYQAQTQTARQAAAARQTRMSSAVTPQGDGRRGARGPAPADDEQAAFEAGFRTG